MKKKTKLATRIGNLIIVVLVITVMLILIGTTIASFYQTIAMYNERTMQTATEVAQAVYGDNVTYLLSRIDNDEYRSVRDQAEEADDSQLIVDYLKEKYGTDSISRMAERYNDKLEQLRENLGVEFVYVSVIQDDFSIDLFDADNRLFSLGYKTELMDKFKSLNGNEVVNPTITHSEYGWLSSGGIPITDTNGNAVAIAFCDINMNNVVRDTILFMSVIFWVCIIIIFLVRLYVNKLVRNTITAPIEDLTEATERFANNEKETYSKEDVAELDIHTGDEIEELYLATRFMQTSIIDYMDNLTKVTAEKERISAELNVATQIQADMLPRIFPPFPERKEFDLFASMDPAKEVGGDFYDFFLVDDDHIAMVIADVSGKGVPAALFMVIAKTLIKNRTLMGGTPSEILHDVNEQLCEGNDAGYFVTVWLAIIQISTGEGVAANAGHEHPALKSAEGKFELVQYRHSPALGMMDGIMFKEHGFKINHGDTIFVYTDGVAEATDANKELYGTDRMLAALNAEPEAGVETLLKNVTQSIDQFVGDAPQFDDITMLSFHLY